MRPLNAALAAGVLVLQAFSVAASVPAQPVIHVVFRSTDQGRTWSRSSQGLPGHSRINAFASLEDAIFAGTDSGIYVSHDEGKNWRPAGGPAGSSSRIVSFATGGRILYAGTDRRGLMLSSGRGLTWAPIESFPSRHVRSLLAYQGRIYAGTDADGVFVSATDGLTWDRLNNGLPPQAQIFAMSMVRGRLFAALYAKGLYAWINGERRWTKAGSLTPLTLAAIGDTIVAGHNPGGIFWSDDLGVTWSPSVPGSPGEFSSRAPVWELAASGRLAFAGASEGVYYSEDRGRSWIRAREGLPVESPGVSFLLKPNLVLVGTVLRSRD